jgi:hypothetical protein
MEAKKKAGTDEQVYWSRTKVAFPYEVAKFAGEKVTFGAWVYPVDASDNVKIRIHDGVTVTDSDFAPADQWTWLEIGATIGSYGAIDRIHFGFVFSGDIDDIAYFCQPIAIFGTQIGEGNWSRPRGEKVFFKASMYTLGFLNGTLDWDLSPYEMKVEQDTEGVIPKNCIGIGCSIEGKNDTEGEILLFCSNDAAPTIYGPVLGSKVSSGPVTRRVFANGLIPVVNGRCFAYLTDDTTGEINADWYNVSIDITYVIID